MPANVTAKATTAAKAMNKRDMVFSLFQLVHAMKYRHQAYPQPPPG